MKTAFCNCSAKKIIVIICTRKSFWSLPPLHLLQYVLHIITKLLHSWTFVANLYLNILTYHSLSPSWLIKASIHSLLLKGEDWNERSPEKGRMSFTWFNQYSVGRLYIFYQFFVSDFTQRVISFLPNINNENYSFHSATNHIQVICGNS